MNKHYLIALVLLQVGQAAQATPSGRSPSVAHYNQPVVSPGNSGGHSNATKAKAQLISGLGTFAPITGPTTISSSGQYVVNNDFSVTSGTGIAITASDVVLDLDNRNIDGTGGGVTGISIASGIAHVLVGNGTVRNMSGSGIAVAGNQCAIVDVDVVGNATGVSIVGTDNVVVDGCRAIANKSAGFSLDDCTNTTITNCTAYNTRGSFSSQGFVSSGGTKNGFDNCVAKDTSTTGSTSDVLAAGFAFDTDEIKSSITNSQSIHTSSPAQGDAKAYGILLNSATSGTITPSAAGTHSSNVLMSLAWRSDSSEIAVAGNEEANEGTSVFSFDGRRVHLEMATVDHAVDESVDWSPNNVYLAVGGQQGTSSILTTNVYAATPEGLDFVTAAANTNPVHSVHWSADGQFLATGDENGDLIIYSFDGNLLTLITSVNHGNVIRTVRWSADGYLAIGGVPSSSIDTRVYSFDGTTLTQVATANHGATINGLAWSPSSKLLAAVGEVASSIDTELYAFDGSSLTSSDTASHGATVRSVSWSRDGLFLATAGDTETVNNTEINIYSVVEGSLTLLSSPVYGATAYSIAWAPNGRYVGVVGDFTAVDQDSNPILNIRVFKVDLSGASQCTVRGNSVNHTTGNFATGVGIEADSLSNEVIENKAFNNDINYQLTTNLYDRGLAGSPTLVQNIGLPPV